jgi:Ca-activated chloride channel homolog
MSDILQLSVMGNKNYIQVLNQPQLIYILSELSPGAGISNVPKPLNFALVLDRSGSMAGEKLSDVKEAVKSIVDQLNPNDVISIVTFETHTQVLVPAQTATNKADIKRQVDKINDGGGTNMAPALREGLMQVQQYHGPDRTSRIVLLTDGEATDEENDSRAEADKAGSMEIPVIGMGFGDGWNQDFIIDLADRSIRAPGSRNGHVDYIQSPGDAAKIFQDVFSSMQIVAQDVTMTTRMVQGLEARRVWQVVPIIKDIGLSVIQGRSVAIPVGELEKGGTAYLYELMLPPRPVGSVRIAQADVTYNVPNMGQQREAIDLVVNYTDNPALFGQTNGHVMNIVEKVQAFKLQTQALNEAELGNVRGATQKLRAAVTILLSQGDNELAQQMQTEADRLEQSGQISEEGKKTIVLTSRKTVKLSD